MKKLIIVLACLMFFSSYAQTASVRKGQFKVNILSPGAEYEFRLTDDATFVVEGGFGLGYSYSSSYGSDFYIGPYLAAQYRYYYNFEKRSGKGKNTLNNSANYVSVIGGMDAGYYSTSDSQFVEHVSGLIGPAWGFQRTYNSGFNLSLDLGIGYGFEEQSDGYLAPIIGFQLGWVIDRQKQ